MWKESETQGDLNTLLPMHWREVSPSIQKPLVTRKYQASPPYILLCLFVYCQQHKKCFRGGYEGNGCPKGLGLRSHASPPTLQHPSLTIPPLFGSPVASFPHVQETAGRLWASLTHFPEFLGRLQPALQEMQHVPPAGCISS